MPRNDDVSPRNATNGRSLSAHPVREHPGSVCILRLSALGDVTHVVPIVHTLRRCWPETRITWVIGRFEHRLVAGLDDVEFVAFDKGRGWREYLKLYRTLQHRKFDYLLLMQVALRANVASLCIRAAVKVGYDRARSKDLHGLFVDQRIAPGGREHVVDGFFGFLRRIGLTAEHKDWRLPIPPEAREFARRHAPASAPLIVISPCSSHPRRNWDAASYAAIADYAIERYGVSVAICGGPSAAERKMMEAICARARHEPLDLVGKDTLPQFAALLAQSSLLISPDSGPAHIATCVGTPVLGLYAASNPRRSGPYNSLHWCVDKYDDAARKYLSRSADAIKWGKKLEYPGVMHLITVDDVKLKLDEFMQQREP